jgi:VanZ family protein
MEKMSAPRTSTRARRYLAAGYVLLIVYASLSPFTGWRDQGVTFGEVLTAPLWLKYTVMDAWINMLAYIPLGVLVALILLGRLGARRTVAVTLLAGTALSASMEYLQMYLPARTSSNLDILTNSLGMLAGAVLAVQIAPSAWFAALMRWRRDGIRRGSGVDFGLALAALWMFAQVNPSLPMLGNTFIKEVERAPFQPVVPEPFGSLAAAVTALNLLMVGCLYLTLVQRRRDALIAVVATLGMVAACKFAAAAVLFKPWAVLLWLNGESMLGITAGLAALVAITRASRRVLSACGATAAIGYLAVGEGLLDGRVPPGLSRLYYWREGHFLTYNGLSHLILFLFPVLLLGYLWRARKWSHLPV